MSGLICIIFFQQIDNLQVTQPGGKKDAADTKDGWVEKCLSLCLEDVLTTRIE